MSLVFRDVKKIPTQAIDVGERWLKPSERRVAELAQQIQADGHQLSPILVRPVTSDTYKIVDGATRLMALRKLNWPDIRAQIVAGLPDEYEIAELVGNVTSKKITVAQKAAMNRRLKELRQKVAMEAGAVEKSKGGRGKKGGVAEAARKAGIPRTSAQRHASKVAQNDKMGRFSDGVSQIYQNCPMCSGTGKLKVQQNAA